MPDTVNLRKETPESSVATDSTESPLMLRSAPVLAWETIEFHPGPKSALWYGIFGVALAVLVFFAYLLRSILSGVVFVLSGILILLHSERPPKPIRVVITKDDLIINDRRYRFGDLEAFNIVESPTGMLALIQSKRFIMPLLHLPLGDQDPEAVKKALRRGIPENTDIHEPLPDLLAHWLGF